MARIKDTRKEDLDGHKKNCEVVINHFINQYPVEAGIYLQDKADAAMKKRIKKIISTNERRG